MKAALLLLFVAGSLLCTTNAFYNAPNCVTGVIVSPPWDAQQQSPQFLCVRRIVQVLYPFPEPWQVTPGLNVELLYQNCSIATDDSPGVPKPVNASFRCAIAPILGNPSYYSVYQVPVPWNSSLNWFKNEPWVLNMTLAAIAQYGPYSGLYYEWSTQNPQCLDALGRACGAQPGNRVGVNRQVTVYNLQSSGSRYVAPYEYVWMTPCTTPACTASDVDCILAPDFGDWSSCFAFNGQYIKQRTRAILRNGTGFGLACPAADQLTQTVTCSQDEIDRTKCVFEQRTSVSSCFGSCGPSSRNVSIYNITSTPLNACIAAANSSVIVVTVTEGCPVNLPCSDSRPSTPTTINCSTRGNAGFNGANVAYIEIEFETSLSFTGNNASLMNRFAVSNTLSNRTAFLNTSGLVIKGTKLQLWMSTSDSDMEMNTGSLFNVFYTKPGNSSNDTLNDLKDSAGFSFPSFACVTVDQSPPALVYAAFHPNSEGEGFNQIFLAFSELVTAPDSEGAPPTSSFIAGGFSVDPFGEGSFQTASIQFYYYFNTEALLVEEEGTIQCVADGIKDLAGNLNVLDSTIPVYWFSNITSVIPVGATDSIKFYRDSVTQYVTSMMIPSILPLDKTILLASARAGNLQILSNYSIFNSTLTIPSFNLVTEDPNPDETTVSKIVVQFRNDLPPMINASSIPIEFDYGSYFTIVYNGTANAVAALPFTEPTFFIRPTDQYVSPVFLVGASATPAERLFTLVFSSTVTSDQAQFLLQYVIYEGVNSINSFVAVDGVRVIVFLLFPFTYSMFQTDSLTFFNPNQIANNPFRRTVSISNALGARPVVISASLSRDGTLFIPNRLTVVYSEEIGTFGVANILRDSVRFAWNNPLVTNVEAVDYTISGASISYYLSVTCVADPCINADLKLRISARGMLGTDGNLAADYENATVTDLVPPQISGVNEIAKGVVVVTLSKNTSATSTQLQQALVPQPVSCMVTPNNSAVCAFSTDFCGSDEVTMEGFAGSFVDYNSNPTTLAQLVATCSRSSGGGCGFLEYWPGFVGILILSAIAPIMILGIVYFAISIRKLSP